MLAAAGSGASPSAAGRRRSSAGSAVSASSAASPGSAGVGRERPKRQCMRPLQVWRNERLIYERPPGSPLPQIRGILLNAAGEPGLGAEASAAAQDVAGVAAAALQDGTSHG
mmetsp:Transcript_104182/g.271279  ORF Transcript_104182/g.271279 Transcript_104182/m.271279 type:complete len:112 (-) Transcript_104182:90-425(-)